MGLLDFLGTPLEGLLSAAGGIIDDLSTSGEEKLAAQLALEREANRFRLAAMDAETAAIKEGAATVRAEAGGESWLQRSWRPILMLTFAAAFAWNMLVVPILGTTPAEIPAEAWTLMKIGVGGYVVGRSAEKGLRTWKGAAEGETK